jgi:hypothetical protein
MPAPPDHDALERLNAEISRETERIVDLQNRIRVLDVEVSGWKMPPAPPSSRAQNPVAPFLAFFVAVVGTHPLGQVVAWALRR